MRRKSRCPVGELQGPASPALVGGILPTPKSSVKGLSTTGQNFFEEAKLGVHVCVKSRPTQSSPDSSLNFPGKNTGVGCHFLLQGIFSTRIEPASFASPALARGFFPTAPPGKPKVFNKYLCKLPETAGVLLVADKPDELNTLPERAWVLLLSVCSERCQDLRSDLCSPTTSLSSGSRPKPPPPVLLEFEPSIMLSAVTPRKPSGLGF